MSIARELGIAPSTAYKRVQHGLHELNAGNAAQAAELRDLEALRLDELQESLWERALEGDLGAISRVLKIMERRARLLGLDAPDETDVSVKPMDAQQANFRRDLLIKRIRYEAPVRGGRARERDGEPAAGRGRPLVERVAARLRVEGEGV